MALIKYTLANGHEGIYNIPWETPTGPLRITIGSDAQNDLQLSADLDVLPKHAILTWAQAPISFVLLDLSEGKTWVNDLPVLKMKALRHLDRIHIGKAEMTYVEIHSEILHEGSPYIGQYCMLYGNEMLKMGDEVVICRCGAVYHRGCWFRMERCSRSGCWYPIRNFLVKRLSGKVILQKVEKDSELTKKFCPAGQDEDKTQFQPDQEIINCPKCFTPYHIGCLLLQETCIHPGCDFPIRKLADTIFNGSDEHDEQGS